MRQGAPNASRSADCSALHRRSAAPVASSGQCEYVSETDPGVLKILLKVKDGAGGNYWWVECGACDTAWQVPYFESVG